MRSAVIVDAVRTPIARRGGALADIHATDLGAVVLRALIERTGIDPAAVDDVVMGCVTQTGEQSGNIGRYAWLAAGLPESVPAATVDRQCGASLQAAHFAAQGVIAGAYDIVIAAGVESMTRVPFGPAGVPGPGGPVGRGLHQRYWASGRGGLVPQGVAADRLARRYGLDRPCLDAFALRSHRLAVQAQDEGRFARELVPVVIDGAVVLDADEGPRRDASLDRMRTLAPAFTADGRITAASSSQISDGAAALLIMTEEKANELRAPIRARFHSFAVTGDDPVAMLTAPISATRRVLERGALRPADIDLFEVNEAFASVPLAWARELDISLDRVNVNGGACALGHPLGATGVRLMATLLCELERVRGHYGLVTICEAGGLANATVIERTN